MRWLNQRLSGERGATAVVVGLLLVPLIGLAAIAVDVGEVYFERAQLQNGADSAALALGDACGRSTTACNALVTAGSIDAQGCGYGASSSLLTLAGLNDRWDSKEALKTICLPSSGGSATVYSSTLTSTGGTTLQHPLAAAIGIAPSGVEAHAKVQWGSPSSAEVGLPLAVSICGLVGAQTANTPVLLRTDNNAPDLHCTGSTTGDSVYTTNHPGDSHPIAGGFGWLTETNGSCATYIDLANPLVGSDQGNNVSSACKSVLDNDQAVGEVIMVPVFDCAVDTSGACVTQISNTVAKYRIVGFAAIKVAGYRFPGVSSSTVNNNPFNTPSLKCTGNCDGVQGYFLRWAFPTSGSIGADQGLGTSIVKLTE